MKELIDMLPLFNCYDHAFIAYSQMKHSLFKIPRPKPGIYYIPFFVYETIDERN